ncbi:programmed cell death protein 2-like [Macrosteles quadrilineatus]|uniref:programmed cell death protein 2-like n=1 Tax=Macrosteles quadrilineatus TaxID=74068 RepID=UPI0023E16554|nr:programmed cell death protein 2-like [Macrosteles quadrilineatus]
MATNKCKVFLGFEDEQITQKFKSVVNFMTNKVGGKPDWVENKPTANPLCQLCGLSLPLIVQIYAPLEKSPYHRTLYIFGCINPNCWNQKGSWVCLRSQILDTKSVETESDRQETTQNFDWCEGADNWEDEENGNFIQGVNNDPSMINGNLSSRMEGLCVAGGGAEGGEEVSAAGAMCNPLSYLATAEIEGDEGEVVTIDTPTTAQTDVIALFDKVKPVPQVPSDSLQFASFFISVCEEDVAKTVSPVNADVYKHMMMDEEVNSVINKTTTEAEVNASDTGEKYEKTLPPHGDKLFHQFITRIQRNPGQILRYIRDGGAPLFLYPPSDVPRCCQHCHGDLVFELQLLPTLITRLQLSGSGSGHIEFGTVLVLSCLRSCWAVEDVARTEYILVQREM